MELELNFIGSIEEITDGIPKYMTIEANVPSTIFFTTDGTTPTNDSPIYVDTFRMPTGKMSVILSAIAVAYDMQVSSLFSQTFGADTTRIRSTRLVGTEGLVLDRYNYGSNYPDGFDADGEVARVLDYDVGELNVRRTKKGHLGIEDGTVVLVGFPKPEETPSLLDDQYQIFSSPEIGEYFNPQALYIKIDNRIDNDIDITLRPFGSMHNVYREAGGKRLYGVGDDAVYVSGGFVRRFYDQKNNKMVSYYFDHNECRYVKNTQDLPSNIPSGNVGITNSAQPLVIKWIYRGRQSSI